VQEIAVERVETMGAAGVSDNAMVDLTEILSDGLSDPSFEELAGCEVQEYKRVTHTPKINNRERLILIIAKCLRNN
jgi:hypothetical protein